LRCRELAVVVVPEAAGRAWRREVAEGPRGRRQGSRGGRRRVEKGGGGGSSRPVAGVPEAADGAWRRKAAEGARGRRRWSLRRLAARGDGRRQREHAAIGTEWIRRR